MKTRSIYIILTLLLLECLLTYPACTRRRGVERRTNPRSRLDVEVRRKGCALMRSRYFDVAIEQLDALKWEKLMEHDIFIREMQSWSDIRIPRFEFFHMVVSNVNRYNFKIKSIKIRYGNKVKDPLEIKEVLKRCKSPAYSLFNFKNILSPKRLMGDKFCLGKIDYAADVIDYQFDFIHPGDRVLRIVAFDWIPVQHRKFFLDIAFTTMGAQPVEKTVTFDFNRLEYRSRGRYFRDPYEKEKEDE